MDEKPKNLLKLTLEKPVYAGRFFEIYQNDCYFLYL